MTDGPDLPPLGATPLLAAAAPLLELLGSCRSVRGDPDVSALRDMAVREFERFATAVRRLDLTADDALIAHRILCASIDDVVMNSEWGRGIWSGRTLMLRFHDNRDAGKDFFDTLDRLIPEADLHYPLLLLMYNCLSLGFQGMYRRQPRLEEKRQQLYDVLKRVGPAVEQSLSPHWRGEDAPYEPLKSAVPAWVIGAGALAILGAVFVLLLALLGGSSDSALAAASTAAPPMPVIQRPVARPMPPAPPPPPLPGPSAAAAIRKFLEPEIRQGLVTVTESATVTRVRIRATGMFGSGSATLETPFVSLLTRIGEALNTEPGRVKVVGHTDNQPIRTVRFPSNFQLSLARAEAARAVVARPMQQPNRLVAEGHAESEPIASNDTPEGREANRRIEIILQRQE